MMTSKFERAAFSYASLICERKKYSAIRILEGAMSAWRRLDPKCVVLLGIGALHLPRVRHLWEDPQRRISCAYCRDMDRVAVPLAESDLKEEQWLRQYARPGRPVIVNLSDFDARFAFTWNDVATVLSNAKTAKSVKVVSNRSREAAAGNATEQAAASDAFHYAMQHSPGEFFAQLDDKAVEASTLDFNVYIIHSRWQQNDATREILRARIGGAIGFFPSRLLPSRRDVSRLAVWLFAAALGPGTTPLSGFARHKDTTRSTGTFHLQLAGLKRWTLEPMDHCQETCGRSVSFIMRPGQFLSLNPDRWYHATSLLPPEEGTSGMVLSIGQEFLEDTDHFHDAGYESRRPRRPRKEP